VFLDHVEHFLERSIASGGYLSPAGDAISPWSTQDTRCSGGRNGLNCFFNVSACTKPPVDEDGHIMRLDLDPQFGHRKGGGCIRRDFVIPGFESESTFWTTAQLTGFLFDRMQPELRARVDAFAVDKQGRSIKQLLRNRRVLGMHIRRGDACPRGASAPTLLAETGTEQRGAEIGLADVGRYCPTDLQKTYGYWLKQFQDKYSVDTVYLATDDLEAEQWCANMTGDASSGLTCHTIAMDRSALEVNATAEPRDHFIERRLTDPVDQNDALDSATLFTSAIADIELLASSQYFIGLFAASMSRQAYQLLFARQQHHRPFVSLDMHWAQPDGTIN